MQQPLLVDAAAGVAMVQAASACVQGNPHLGSGYTARQAEFWWCTKAPAWAGRPRAGRLVYIDVGANYANTIRLHDDIGCFAGCAGRRSPWEGYAFEASPIIWPYLVQFAAYLNGEGPRPEMEVPDSGSSDDAVRYHARRFGCAGHKARLDAWHCIINHTAPALRRAAHVNQRYYKSSSLPRAQSPRLDAAQPPPRPLARFNSSSYVRSQLDTALVAAPPAPRHTAIPTLPCTGIDLQPDPVSHPDDIIEPRCRLR